MGQFYMLTHRDTERGHQTSVSAGHIYWNPPYQGELGDQTHSLRIRSWVLYPTSYCATTKGGASMFNLHCDWRTSRDQWKVFMRWPPLVRQVTHQGKSLLHHVGWSQQQHIQSLKKSREIVHGCPPRILYNNLKDFKWCWNNLKTPCWNPKTSSTVTRFSGNHTKDNPL